MSFTDRKEPVLDQQNTHSGTKDRAHSDSCVWTYVWQMETAKAPGDTQDVPATKEKTGQKEKGSERQAAGDGRGVLGDVWLFWSF